LENETVAERQSRVTRIGDLWERHVKSCLNEKLQHKGIEIIIGKNEQDVKERSKILWRMLSTPIRASTTHDSVWGDIDLVAVKDNIPIAVISCKVSLHGRFTETLFWSVLFRLQTRTRMVLATPDGGRAGKKGVWQSEWGTCENPTKDRLLAESYLDGVYVENSREFCSDIREGEATAIGGITRPLNELPDDLLRWSEGKKFIFSKKESKGFF
jgi:hypothetical protein